ncbi:MAG TPA: glycosyltransferase [Kofleriaceae bacterium]|jgi:mannosylfructose-phosphate synthase|nr:glycosyltransferase [Kofleriaceae bacterium]
MTRDEPEIARELEDEVRELFARHGLPEAEPGVDRSEHSQHAGACDRILMISTHGYWSDPPPAGATDTGGQTLYVLQISKEWARSGRKVLILARWFAPYARVDQLAQGLWLVRIPAGGDRFVRKEDIYPLAPELAEYATAVAARFGAQAVMGHYADGMVVAAEVATRRGLPFLAMPHSLALTKIAGLGLAPGDLATWFDEHYRFGAREEYELAAMTQADCVVGCLPDQLDVLSRVYRLRTPRDVVAPGVAPVFFEAGDAPPDPEIPARFGLSPGRFLVVTGRLAETKNIPGAVALLGEARACAPARFDRVMLAVVGGSPEPREPEEFAVEAKIEAAMARYGLHRRDVRRVPAQTWPVVAQLLRQSLFYVGMQHFEPFGMGAAEALAVGAPVLISKHAGIARALEGAPPGETCALLVDPADPRGAARRLIDALDAPADLERMREAGRRLARQAFSWPNGAARLGAVLDGLVAQPPARRRNARGHHRLASTWRGDRPRIASQHAWSAEQLLPRILEAQRIAARAGRRLIVAIGGESGAGKTEIAHCLGIGLRRHRLWSALLPGDVFFRLPPSANHEARLAADRAGQLADYIGPLREIDLEALDHTLAEAADLRTTTILCPSDCRPLSARRYARVPLYLAERQVVFVDLTYSMLLDTPALRIFLESDYLERREYIQRRNTARDPDQDFSFIMKVLAVEHEQIQRTAVRAHLCVDKRGAVRDTSRLAIVRTAAGAQE